MPPEMSHQSQNGAAVAARLPFDRRAIFVASSVVLDAFAMVVAICIASWVEFGNWNPLRVVLQPDQNIRPMLVSMLVSVVLGSLGTQLVVRQGVPRPSAARALVTFLFTLSAVNVTINLSRVYYSRQVLLLGVTVWLGLALAIRAIRALRPWTEQVVAISAEKSLIEDMRAARHLSVIAALAPQEQAPSEPPPRGATVAIDLRAVLSDSMAGFVGSASTAGYNLRSLTGLYEEHTGRVALVHLAEGWEINTPLALRAPFFPLKRVVETILVVATAPLWLVLAGLSALAVKLWGGPGPIVFRQTRVGQGDRLFTLYKFRSMEEGADEDGARMAAVDDPRISPAGRILRRLRLDEIPQLINVVKGEMALVGPRAEQPDMVMAFERAIPFYSYRHAVRPGLTGWAQVNYGYAATMEETIVKLSYDLYYVRHMSPVLDLTILWRSVWTVLTGRGAR